MSRWSGEPGPLQRGLQLIALTAFAIAQPLFDLLGRNAAFFVAHRTGPGAILAFTALVALAPAVALFALSAPLFGIRASAGRVVHAASVGALAALGLMVALVRMTGMGLWVAAATFAVLATAIGMSYLRARAFRSLLTLASPLALVVVGMFVLATPVRYLVFPPAVGAPGAEVQASQGRSAVPPVFVLVLDELSTGSLVRPDGSVDAERFPSFARLTAGSTWYRDATTVATGTDHAIPALLTGIQPHERKIPSFSQYPQNLFTLLSVTHQLRVSEFVTHLCPPVFCSPSDDDRSSFTGLMRDAAVVYLHIASPPDAAARLLPPLGDRWAGFGGDGRPHEDDPLAGADPEERTWLQEALAERRRSHEGEKTRDFLREVARRPDSRPDLWYLHLQLPHPPWRYLPSGQVYPTRGATPGYTHERRFIDDPHVVSAALQRALVQTRYADAVVGEVLDHLESTGLYDDTLLVVTSDHGASWVPGAGRRDITGSKADSTLWIPMFVKYPGQREGVVEDINAQLTDVLPTIAQVVGVSPGWPVDGTPLLRGDRRSSKRVFTSGRLVEIQPDSDAPARWAAEIDRLFGRSGRPDDLFGFGPNRELVGRPVSELPRLEGRGTIELRGDTTPFEDVDPDARVLPAYVRGALEGVEAGEAVAVSLNGVVAGVGYAYVEREMVEMAVLISPRHFREGRNTLEVYVIGESDGLRPVGLRSGAR